MREGVRPESKPGHAPSREKEPVMDLSFLFAVFLPISFGPNLAIVYMIGRLGRGLVQAKPSRKEPALLAHHLACVAHAAFCSTALPVLFIVFFPIYVENVDL